MSEEKEPIIDFSSLYKKEIKQKIGARKQILKEYHPEGHRAKKAANELEQLEAILKKL